MSIAVSGASGRLGSRIIEALLALDDPEKPPLIALSRDTSSMSFAGVNVRQADYAQPDQMTSALAGVEVLVLISAPVKAGVDRVQLHRNAIQAAQEAGVGCVLYTSVIGNGDESGTWYAETQEVNRVTERDLMDSGLRWIICRNGLYLDLDLMHLRAAGPDGVYSNNAGTGRCGYIAISELAFAIARLTLEAHQGRGTNRTVNLIGETVTQQELVALANQVFGMEVRYQPISEAANVDRLMAHPMIARRGLEVARMLTGCFQCMSRGAFDVEPQFHLAAGRPAKPLAQQMSELDPL
ncbi:MAG: NAD(P)H-binding protein [Pseudomonadota bacterium]